MSSTAVLAVLQKQTISFLPPETVTFGDGPLLLTATASSGLPVQFKVISGPANLSGNTITVSGAGTILIRASQPGNVPTYLNPPVSLNYFKPAGTVERYIIVAKSDQRIEIEVPPGQIYGGPSFAARASASSSLHVTLGIISGPVVINGNAIEATGAGTVVLRGVQEGDANYNPATAVYSFAIDKANQTISFVQQNNRSFGDAPFEISASASSGLPVRFEVLSGPAHIERNKITLTGAGPIVVRATQDGSSDFNPVTAEQSFVAGKAKQSISFLKPEDKTFGDAPFSLHATASSGLPVRFSVSSGPARVDGNQLILIGAGTVNLRASQSGDDNYHAAAVAEQSFVVKKVAQIIDFEALDTKTFGDPPIIVNAVSSAGLPFTLS